MKIRAKIEKFKFLIATLILLFFGISFCFASNNKIFHNNFIDNISKPQALVYESIGNLFQEEYPIGGNYWSDYVGEDKKKGPKQDEPGSDGIWDTPYKFYGGEDRYPFVRENGWKCGNNKCESELGETFESCYQDCIKEGIEKYFPYYYFSANERYFPASFYFDGNANTGDNEDHYTSEFWDKNYVYIHTVEREDYFTIQYWLYSAYNEHWRYPDHENDWDATIFIVFNRNNLVQPIEVRYARHEYIRPYSWDAIDKIDGTHPVVYVAEGSHGAYPTTGMRSGDVFELGGRELRHGHFNWYSTIVGKGCFEERFFPVEGVVEDRTFCNLQPKLIKGDHQPYPREWLAGHQGYWPRDFFGDALWAKFRRLDAPWMRETWEQPRPEGWVGWLEYILRSLADLHVYDPLGRHIGINYETGEIEIQIPDAIYLKEIDGQYILIPNPIDGDYRVEIIGVEEESYSLMTIRSQDEDIVYWKEDEDISISKGEVHTFIQTQTPWAIPKYLKESSINKLKESKTGNEKIDKEIDKIIGHIKNSLEDKKGSLWLDDWHLKPETRNIKVFDEQRAAVKRILVDLGECKKNTRIELSPEAEQIFKEVINNLVLADKLLAQTLLEDAKVIDIKNSKFGKVVRNLISKAEKEYQKGLEGLEKPICEEHLFYPQEKAITSLAKSWLFSQEAIKMAESESEKQSHLMGVIQVAGVSFLSPGQISQGYKFIPKEKLLFIRIFSKTIEVLIYGFGLLIILKLFTLFLKKSLKNINIKALLISVATGMIPIILISYIYSFFSHPIVEAIPFTKELWDQLFIFGISSIPVFLVLILSFILFKKFPETWKDIKIRLLYLILMLATFVYSVVLTIDLYIGPRAREPISHLDLLKDTIYSIYLPSYLVSFLGVIFAPIALIYSGVIIIPTAFIITKGIKNRGWRIGFIVVMTILMLLVSGFFLGLTFWE